MNRRYTWVYDQDAMYKKGQILLQHYNDQGFRTHVFSAEEFEQMTSYEFCSQMNSAYESGYKHAMADLRRFIGIKD